MDYLLQHQLQRQCSRHAQEKFFTDRVQNPVKYRLVEWMGGASCISCVRIPSLNRRKHQCERFF